MEEVLLADVRAHPFAQDNRPPMSGEEHCRDERGEIARMLSVEEIHLLVPEKPGEREDGSGVEIPPDIEGEERDFRRDCCRCKA